MCLKQPLSAQTSVFWVPSLYIHLYTWSPTVTSNSTLSRLYLWYTSASACFPSSVLSISRTPHDLSSCTKKLGGAGGVILGLFSFPTHIKPLTKSCQFYLLDDLSNPSILTDVSVDHGTNICHLDNCSRLPTGPSTSTLASLQSIFLY